LRFRFRFAFKSLSLYARAARVDTHFGREKEEDTRLSLLSVFLLDDADLYFFLAASYKRTHKKT